jgi:GAF domain-containing protein
MGPLSQGRAASGGSAKGSRMKRDRGLAAEVRALLRRLAKSEERSVLAQALDLVSERSGCESVGIRWKAEEDYPYYLTRGFGRDFVVMEGPLCERDIAGQILRGPDGRPQLACLCGAVIQGRTDPSAPCFTKAGSFWTNGTTAMLRDDPPGARGIVIRGYCNAQGYESVALIPLRTGEQTLGLLQLNSRTAGRFSQELIAEYEQVAAEIASALVASRG